MVVLHDGRIAFEWYVDTMDADRPHILMSATKSVVGLLVGILQAAGEIDVDADVASVLPELATTAYGNATIRQLLDMRAGVVLPLTQL